MQNIGKKRAGREVNVRGEGKFCWREDVHSISYERKKECVCLQTIKKNDDVETAIIFERQ